MGALESACRSTQAAANPIQSTGAKCNLHLENLQKLTGKAVYTDANEKMMLSKEPGLLERIRSVDEWRHTNLGHVRRK